MVSLINFRDEYPIHITHSPFFKNTSEVIDYFEFVTENDPGWIKDHQLLFKDFLVYIDTLSNEKTLSFENARRISKIAKGYLRTYSFENEKIPCILFNTVSRYARTLFRFMCTNNQALEFKTKNFKSENIIHLKTFLETGSLNLKGLKNSQILNLWKMGKYYEIEGGFTELLFPRMIQIDFLQTFDDVIQKKKFRLIKQSLNLINEEFKFFQIEMPVFRRFKLYLIRDPKKLEQTFLNLLSYISQPDQFEIILTTLQPTPIKGETFWKILSCCTNIIHLSVKRNSTKYLSHYLSAGLLNQKNIVSLDLENCAKIGNNLLKVVQIRTFNLCFLDLGGTHITDKGLKYLKKCKNLTTVSLNYCRKITSEGIITLLRHSKTIISLDLANTYTNNKVLEALKPYDALFFLNITHCTELAVKEINAFIRLRRDVKVLT